MPKQNGIVENNKHVVQSCLGIGVLKGNECNQGKFESDYLP